MAISCSCDFDGGIWGVGNLRDVTCRTPRKCSACNKQISIGDCIYMQSMFDYDDMKTASPVFVCEECGDMALNIIDLGYCFSFSKSVRQQWLDYLHNTQPNNPAVSTRRT